MTNGSFRWDRTDLKDGLAHGSIAVIDDDFRVLESLQNLLASFGYRSETYLSAEDFLESDGASHAPV